MDEKRLKEFIVRAKQNTYASSGEGGELVLADGSKELVFEDGALRYRDRYFGSRNFAGQEVIFENKKAIWGMNYYGQMVASTIYTKRVYKFLQKALKMVSIKELFRGPAEFFEGDLRYVNASEGELASFTGFEMIYYKGKQVYQLYYHGGFIKK